MLTYELLLEQNGATDLTSVPVAINDLCYYSIEVIFTGSFVIHITNEPAQVKIENEISLKELKGLILTGFISLVFIILALFFRK